LIAIALPVLAVATVVVLTSRADAEETKTATALIRFERFDGALGAGLGAAFEEDDRLRAVRAVARGRGLDPGVIVSSLRVSANSVTGIVGISATRPSAAEARAIAQDFAGSFVLVSRQRLRDRAREARRYTDFLLRQSDRSALSGARRAVLHAERNALTGFLDRLGERRYPVVAQDAQLRTPPTSTAGLLSGLLAAVAGLALALMVVRIADRRRPQSVSGATDPPSVKPAETSAGLADPTA